MSADGNGEAIAVLAVTADESFASACRDRLPTAGGLSVTTVESVSAALDRLRGDETVDCIVSDHDLPDTDGIALLETVRAQHPTLPFVLFTDEGDESVASRAISLDVTEYLVKDGQDGQYGRLAGLIEDAVAFQRRRTRLADTETRVRTLLDSARDAIAVVQDGRVAYVNRAGVDLLGASNDDEVVGRAVETVVEADGDDADPTALLPSVQAGERSLHETEFDLRQLDGGAVPVELTATHIEWSDGPAVALVVREIADQRASEHELRRFRRAVEAAGHAIYITDPDGTIEYVNPAFERITGYDAAEAVGEDPSLLSSGEMPETYYERLWATLTDGDVWKEEIRDRRQSGELYHAHQTIAPVVEDGDVSAFVAIQTEITEQKEREQRLRQFEQAVEAANDLIAAVDTDYRFLFANEAYREFYGIDPEEVTETTLPEVLDEETWAAIGPRVDRKLTGEHVQFETTRPAADGSDRTFDVRYYPLRTDDGEVYGSVATLRDRTEQRERERQLAALDRLLRHNLQNELNVISGRAELVDERASEEVAALTEPIQRAARRLLETTDKQRDVVDLLAEPPTETTLDLTETVGAAVERLRAAHPDAEITTDLTADIALRTVGELGRAVEELVENAVVHGAEESPRVSVTTRVEADHVWISVADNGPGIPDSERSVIEGDADIDPLLHSSGMGLWLVKRIVSRAGGTLRFDDDGTGTTVVISLPTAAGDETA